MSLLNIRHNRASRLLLLVGAASIATYTAASLSINAFKYLAVILQMLVIVCTIRLLISNKKQINWPKAHAILAILFLYPTIHIYYAVTQTFELKKITDAAFIISPYYQLPIVALAITAYLQRTQYNLNEVIKQYLFLAAPFVGTLAIFGYFQISSTLVGNIYNLFNNIFIPAIALLFFQQRLGGKILAYSSLATMLILVALIGSRSYFLLCIYVAVLAVLSGSLEHKMRRIVGLIAVIVIFALVILPTTPNLFNNDQVVLSQKINMDSLLDALHMTFSSGDLFHLLFWEGNSRTQVLIDAFSDFDTTNFFIGKTVFGLYKSFVERNAIEVGWAQEAFWFGMVYVSLVFVIMIASWLRLRRQHRLYKQDYTYFLGSMIFIRFLDGWVYGMPTYDVYNLLFFMALIAGCVKKTQPLNLNKGRQLELHGPRIEFSSHA